jgi:hypothetical protein
VPGRVPADLLGLCFNFFEEDPITRFCPNAACCLRCKRPGHQADECSRPRVLLGDKRPRRKKVGSLETGRRVEAWPRSRARRCSPPPPPTVDTTPPGIGCPIDDELYPPSICEPPSSPSPPPFGVPERRPQVELCVIPRSEEIAAAEQVLDLTPVAVVGGNRPSVAVAELRRWLNVHPRIKCHHSSVLSRGLHNLFFVLQ